MGHEPLSTQTSQFKAANQECVGGNPNATMLIRSQESESDKLKDSFMLVVQQTPLREQQS